MKWMERRGVGMAEACCGWDAGRFGGRSAVVRQSFGSRSNGTQSRYLPGIAWMGILTV